MKKYQEEINRLLKVLQHKGSTRSIYLDRINNHAVRAHFSKETLYFEHNIGGVKRPTKAESSVLLEGLVDYYQELCEDSNDLTTFLEGKSFVAELVVFSGQMDFKVASWKEGAITWDTEL
jgi:hypothetical protein